MKTSVGHIVGLLSAACIAVPAGTGTASAAATSPAIGTASTASNAHMRTFDPVPPALRLVGTDKLGVSALAPTVGNVAIDGIVGAAREAGLAAGKLLVTVEKVVDELPPAMNNVVLPHFVVTAVSHCPGGAWPSYAHGHYARDNDFYLKWDAIARDRAQFTAWIDRHVLGTADVGEYQASLAAEAAPA